MTPTELKTLIQNREIVTVEQLPVEPYDKNELLVLITFEPETDERQ